MRKMEGLYKNYFKELTSYLFCLVPLLEALDWERSSREIIQAFPHFATRLGFNHFIQLMITLGFQYKQFQTSLSNLNDEFLPCLFLTQDKLPHVLLSRQNGEYIIYSGEKEKKVNDLLKQKELFLYFINPINRNMKLNAANPRYDFLNFLKIFVFN